MCSAHKQGETLSIPTGSCVPIRGAYHVSPLWFPLRPLPPSSSSHMRPYIIPLSLVRLTFPWVGAKFLPPWSAWPLAYFPVQSIFHSSYPGRRSKGVARLLATPWSLPQSATTPRFIPKTSVASVSGSPSPPLPDRRLRRGVPLSPWACLL